MLRIPCRSALISSGHCPSVQGLLLPNHGGVFGSRLPSCLLLGIRASDLPKLRSESGALKLSCNQETPRFCLSLFRKASVHAWRFLEDEATFPTRRPPRCLGGIAFYDSDEV